MYKYKYRMVLPGSLYIQVAAGTIELAHAVRVAFSLLGRLVVEPHRCLGVRAERLRKSAERSAALLCATSPFTTNQPSLLVASVTLGFLSSKPTGCRERRCALRRVLPVVSSTRIWQ